MTRYLLLSIRETDSRPVAKVCLRLQCHPLHARTFRVQVFRVLMYPQRPLRGSHVLQERQCKSRLFEDWGVALGCHRGGFRGGYLGERRTSPAQRKET